MFTIIAQTTRVYSIVHNQLGRFVHLMRFPARYRSSGTQHLLIAIIRYFSERTVVFCGKRLNYGRRVGLGAAERDEDGRPTAVGATRVHRP